MTQTFRPIQTNLDLGSDFLTPYLAYFLGGLCVGETININDKKYWTCLVRHNPPLEYSELEPHLNKVQSVASHIGKQDSIFMNDYFPNLRSAEHGRLLFSAGKKGFLTLFEELKDYDLDTFIRDIHDSLVSSNVAVLKSFIIGIFDTKGSYDTTLKKIAVDVRSEVTANLIMEVLDILNISYNYNPPRTNNRPGVPRYSQIRIKYTDYVPTLGYLSDKKLIHITTNLDKLNVEYNVIDNLTIPLEGLKLISL